MKRFFLFLIFLFVIGCSKEYVNVERDEVIPKDIIKVTPEMDKHKPILHSDEFKEPVPLEAISTAGAEDSPFIPSDRKEMYFVFVPDTRIPPEKQLFDGASGIWVSEYKDGWQKPRRVWLQDAGKLSLDGCTFVQGDEMMFCSAREGYTGMHWVKAKQIDGEWRDWEFSDFPDEFKVGELHMHDDKTYYHSDLEGGKGGTDIWMLENGVAKNIEAVNTEADEGMPYISKDGNELWFHRWYKGSPAVFRSKKIDGEWHNPELIVETFAGEPTLDWEGNLYFVHHYYDDGEMLEADIYVAYKR